MRGTCLQGKVKEYDFTKLSEGLRVRSIILNMREGGNRNYHKNSYQRELFS